MAISFEFYFIIYKTIIKHKKNKNFELIKSSNFQASLTLGGTEPFERLKPL